MLVVLCLLLFCNCAISQAPCHDYAVNGCNKDPDGEILAINAESQQNCQQYCLITAGCLFYSYDERTILNVNCHLFEEPFHLYLDHCDVHSGPLNQDQTSTCSHPDENSCEVEQFEDCVLYGKVLERNLAAPDVSICEEFCSLNQGEGCRYWQWNREKEICDLFDSADKKCHIEFGPKHFSPNECGSTETTTVPTTSPTTTAPTTPSTTTSSTTTPSGPEPSFLYISGGILNMDTLQRKNCYDTLPGRLSSPAWSMGAVVPFQGKDSLMVCGGFENTDCFVWTSSGWQSLHTPFFNKRFGAGSSPLPGDDGDIIVTGGADQDSLSTSVVYRDGSFRYYAGSMPELISSHCQVTVGEDVLVIGGMNKYPSRASGNVYKLSQGIWSSGQPSLRQARNYHMCAVLANEVFVIGGRDGGNFGGNDLSSVEVLSPGSNSWVSGPSLPKPVHLGHAVVYKNSIYVIGGWENEKIYRLDSGASRWVTEHATYKSYGKSVSPAQLLFEDQLHC